MERKKKNGFLHGIFFFFFDNVKPAMCAIFNPEEKNEKMEDLTRCFWTSTNSDI